MTLNPELFEAYVAEQLVSKGNILDFGIVEMIQNPVFASGDVRWRIPHLKSLESTGDESKLDGTDLIPEQIDNYAEYGVIVRRAKVWTSTEFGSVPAGISPVQHIAPQVSGYAARQIQKNLAAVARGAFATALAAHVVDGSSTTIVANSLVDADVKVGENSQLLTTILFHSKVFGDLQKLGLVSWVAASTFGEQLLRTGQIPTVLGKRVQISNDFCAPLLAVCEAVITSGAITSVIVHNGGMGHASTPTATVTAYKIVAGVRTTIDTSTVALDVTTSSGVVTAVAVHSGGGGSGLTGDGLVVNISIACANPIYPSYITGDNAFAVGYQKGLALKQGEDILKGGGSEYLKISTHYAPHLKGVSYKTSATANPSVAELTKAASYEVVQPDTDKILAVQILSR